MKRADKSALDISLEDVNAAREKLAALEQAQYVRKCRTDLLEFSRFMMPDPEAPNDHTRSRYEAAVFHIEVARALEAVERGEIRQLIFCMPPRHGKQVADFVDVLTIDGWKKHGELQVGDSVFGPDGKPVRVIAVSEPSNEKMLVELTNGEKITCHPNHEWFVYDRAQREGRRWRVMETREMAKRQLWNGPAGKRGGRATLQLPDIEAVEFSSKMLPLHPYAFGAWLGDGTSAQALLAHDTRDIEVVEAIEGCGYKVSRKRVQRETGVGYAYFSGGFRAALRGLGVLKNKHIPESYLRSSIEQRLQLIAGLIDTDGSVELHTGRVRFSTCSEALRDGVVDLCTTLGFRPYVISVPPQVSSSGVVGRCVTYQVCFQPNRSIPTRIPRKQILKFASRRRIGIASVKPTQDAPGRCIQVEREDGLYLAGRSLVPTHNSQLVTKNLVAWVMGKHPEWDIAVGSYSDTMAQDFGADTRSILTSKRFKQVFPDYQLKRGGSAKDNIQSVYGGRAVFVGRGGALTGRGMCLGVADDIFKDHEEARSETIRDQAWNWFTKVFMTRRMGPKLIVIVMTRWHSDDIIGRITDPENPNYNEIEAKKWKIIRLPAIAEDGDVLGRAPGEALWPERFDLDFLHSQQRLDPLGFAALYQQRPTVADGVHFRREDIRYYRRDELPEKLTYYASSDHAVGEKQRNDPSCLLSVGVDRFDNIYLLECDWRRMSADVAVEAMLQMMGGSRRPLIWWAEKGHISKSIGPFLRKRMAEEGIYVNVVEVTPAGDKAQRAQSISGRVAQGKVFFPRDALWTEKAINELLAFPNGTHDDFVDALSYIGLGLGYQFKPGGEPKKSKEPTFGTLEWAKAADRAVKARDRAFRFGGF